MVQCPHCGYPVEPELQSCGSCGQPLPGTTEGNPYAPPRQPHQPPPGSAYAYAYPSPHTLPNSGKAIASMVLGICSIVIYPLGFLLGPLAIIFHVIARRDLRRHPPAMKGGGMNTAGLVTGIIGTFFGALVFGVAVGIACGAIDPTEMQLTGIAPLQ